MKETFRVAIAINIGLMTLLGGQLAIETVAWWWTADTTTFDAPLLNAMKFAVAGAAALGVGLSIALPSVRRRRIAVRA